MKPEIEWSRGSRRLRIGPRDVDLPGPIDQAFAWEKKRVILVLLDSPAILLVLDYEGRVIHSFPPPEGFSFYYMGYRPNDEVSVVCVTSTPIDGWQDWQFRINLERGELERFAPSK